MYYKNVTLSIEEAVGQETSKGFECKDEFCEVMREIADEYDVTMDKVLNIFYNQI